MTMTPRTIAALALVPALLTGCGAATAESTTGSVRTVETSLGKVSVPTDIDSVVVLEGRRDLDIVLSLGLPLTGYPYEEKGSLDLTSPTADALETAQQNGAKELFLADEINLEAIIGADPDLIVSRAEDVEPIRAELEAIAPVIAIGDQSTSTWQDDLELVAAATGTEDRAQALIEDYSTRVSALKDQYGPALRENTFVPLSYNGESLEVRPNRLLSLNLRDLGATPSKAFQDAIDGEEVAFSPEQTVEGFADASAVVALINDKQVWDDFQDNSLVKQLPAFQDGNVTRGDKQTHEGAALTAQHNLTVIEQLLKTL